MYIILNVPPIDNICKRDMLSLYVHSNVPHPFENSQIKRKQCDNMRVK